MGTRILAGRYELMGKIGEGGMAVVFKAMDRLLSRNVAIKILRPEYTKDIVFIESFRRESQMAAGLIHPNIVNIYDVGKEGNIYYIVMELIEGEPLSDIIKREGSLDPERASSITRQVASGLSMAHRNHLIHRDVKPHNIMITKDGTAKITDFGIAKRVTSETLVEQQKENVMGSVHYFSPEQARGGYIDEKSDIYSLGICLYEMLTGKVPFDGATAVEVAVKHMNEEMVPPTVLNPGIPKDLEDIVLKATSKLQINRYKSMEDLITDLSLVRFSRKNETAFASASAEASAAASQEKAPEEKADKKSEPEKMKKKKFLHPQRYIAIILAVLLAVPVSKLISDEIKKSKTQVVEIKTVEVPNLDGYTKEEAEEILKKYGLTLEVDLTIPSDVYGEGEIMSQTPKKGSVVKSGQSVKVNVSQGKSTFTVPHVEGKSLSEAKYKLESLGYELGSVSYIDTDEVDKNFVYSQKPASGTELEKGGKVNLVVSQGKAQAEFDLTGMDLEDAKQLIEEKGLKLGICSYKTSNKIKENAIISHSPSPGATPAPGTSIDLIISSGTRSGEEMESTGAGIESGDNVSADDAGSSSGEEAGMEGEISIVVDLTQAEIEEVTVKLTVSDINGVRSSTYECYRSEGQRVIMVPGSGTDGKIYVSFNDVIVGKYVNIDFAAGTYEGPQ